MNDLTDRQLRVIRIALRDVFSSTVLQVNSRTLTGLNPISSKMERLSILLRENPIEP